MTYRAMRIRAMRGHFKVAPMGDPAIGKETHAPQEADVEAVLRQLLNSESVSPSVARHVGSFVSRH